MKLSPSDRPAALAQRICPVTGESLGDHGTPIKVRVRDRDVFVCCKGCIEELQQNPEKYLGEVGR
ncbi:MAG: TRASH domain-containing protein [Planctomycetes bacterium]|nr:TRASH domain-containing protein [Planctomycetia bacterium]MBI3468497.1 TRASH domain-containing protein [Planctomycetota bacterium]